ncbi:MAG: hypothetical protein FJX68_12665 [Alphaproteobacteria bacterium]|nr:hypothetical protein [Alphaproteobacteria bacterium]
MTLLTVVDYFCRRTGLPVPGTVYGTTDPQLKQIEALLEEEGNDLARRNDWERITYEASHTTLAVEDQGAIATIASNGFRHIKNETIWDYTDQLPVMGPLNGKEWQATKAAVASGFRYRYRIRGGKLLSNPAPPAGHNWRFEYVSYNWVLAADGTTFRQYFGADSDTILLPEDLLLAGLRWRWKKEKGFDYAEDMRTYEMQVKDAIGRDAAKPRLYADAEVWRGPRPGIFVPDGNWITS